MIFTHVLLGLTALGSTISLELENGPRRGQSEGSDVLSDDFQAFRLRLRTPLRQGFKLTVHDVEAFTSTAVDKGI